MSARFRSLLLAVLAAGFALRVMLVFGLPLLKLGGQVDEWFLVDDSWYCLNIARNIARGEGWTHDGIHETNGFQPLFVFAMVPVYAAFDGGDAGDAALADGGGGDDRTPVYVALLLLALFQVGAAGWLGLFVRRLTGRAGLGLLAAGAFAFSPNVVGVGVNGMETSIALFVAAAALALWLRERDRDMPLRWRFVAGFGLLLGAGLWARLDLALLAVAVGLDLAGVLLRQRRYRELVTKGAALAALTIAVYAPFMALGHARVGRPLPESGPAVRQLSRIRQVGPMERLPGYLMENMQKAVAFSVLEAPVLPNVRMMRRRDGHYFAAADAVLLVNLPLLVLFGAVVWRASRRRREAARRLRERLQPAVLFALLLILAYALWVFGDHYFYRYLHPVVWVTLAVLVSALSLLPRRGAIAMGALFGVVVAANAAVELPSMLDPEGRIDWELLQLEAKRALDLAPGERVGAFQSGYVTYWDDDPDRPIVNLDGVVNGSAFEALRDRRLPDYMARERIRYVVDWANSRALLVHGGFRHDALAPIAARGGIHVIPVAAPPTPPPVR